MEELELPDPGTSNRELLDQAVRLRWQIEQLEGHLLEQVAEIDRRRAFEDDGAVTVIGWLKTRCRMDAGRAGKLVKLARAEAAFPELHQAHLEGRVSGCEASRVAHGVDTYRRDLERHGASDSSIEHAMRDLRRALLDSAENGEGPDRLRREIDSHRHRLAADAVAFDEWVAFQQRELYFYTTFDGMVDIRGTLDPISAATVRSAIESLSKPSSASDQLTAKQRRADALVQLAGRALGGGQLPRTGGQRPHINVTVSEQTLVAEADTPGTAPADLRNHGPISGEAARLFACDGEITRIVHDPESEVLDVGRVQRVVPRALRKALVLRDGGCAHPMCDRPVEWCDAHHLKSWAQGGPTTLDNVVLLCRRHHTEVHLKGSNLRWENGRLRIDEDVGDHRLPTRPRALPESEPQAD
jgi:hypothetical protein